MQFETATALFPVRISPNPDWDIIPAISESLEIDSQWYFGCSSQFREDTLEWRSGLDGGNS